MARGLPYILSSDEKATESVEERSGRPLRSTAREDLNGALKLGILALGVAWIECDLDGRRDADAFQAFAIHQHIVDREQQQASVGDQERSGREHGAFCAHADEFAKPVFLEPERQHLLA